MLAAAPARVVLDKGIPELQAAVETGQVSVSAASEVAEMPANRQRELVASRPKAVVAAAKNRKRQPVYGATFLWNRS